MKKFSFTLLMISTLSVILLTFSCSNSSNTGESEQKEAILSGEELVVRGEYLVTIMGCNDCHSPKRMGAKGPELIPDLLLSGYPSERPILDFDKDLTSQGFAVFYPDLTGSAGPWGISFAANLTPDPSGIGTWTEDQFKRALKEGKFKGIDGARQLLPPMPYENFRNIKDEDVEAIFAYLKSLNPVQNVVPAAILPDEM